MDLKNLIKEALKEALLDDMAGVSPAATESGAAGDTPSANPTDTTSVVVEDVDADALDSAQKAR